MELRIRIRQSPQLNIQGQPIHYAGNSPQSLNVVTAPLPTGRQWPNYGYVDATDDVSDIYKLKLTWTNDRNIDGVSTPGEFQRKRAVSGQLSFEGEAYKNIRKWLIEDISAPLNTVDVQVHHLGCDTYDEFSFKASDLRWCEGQGCVLEVSMKQNDEALDCVRKTMIADNHKNWFQTIPANNKKHPRFGYCNEIRPNGMLICLWYIMNITAGVFFTVVFPIILGYNALVATLKVMIAALNKVLDFLGFNTINFNLDIINFDDLFKPFGQFFVESGGCGREHPAPLIRDYISNVCEKCKITVDHLSAPIFFAEHMPVETSSRGVVQVKNPHYYACYLHAQVKRGIRRFHGLMPLIPGGMGSQLNTTDYYIPDNAPQHTLDTFLDELKGVYNAEWRIVNNTLYFQRRDFFINGGYVLDFSANSADRLKLLEGICYETV